MKIRDSREIGSSHTLGIRIQEGRSIALANHLMKGKITMFTAIARWILPAALLDFFNRSIKNSKAYRKRLVGLSSHYEEFESDDWSLFRMAIAHCDNLLEFGCGNSTKFVAENFPCNIRSLETDANWARAVSSENLPSVEIIHVDLGPVGKWGRPLDYAQRNQFSSYLSAGFAGDFVPDVVLIDGRFRVAAFCSVLMNTAVGTKIVFDDYVARPWYKVVEEIVAPTQLGSRQALFVRPENLDLNLAKEMTRDFLMVMD